MSSPTISTCSARRIAGEYHSGHGLKWLSNASYLTADERSRVLATVARCKRETGDRSVGIKPASYIGEPSPLAIVDYGPGRRIFAAVYRIEAARPGNAVSQA